MLSVVIPSHNEEQSIGETIKELYKVLTDEAIDHEILVVDDCSVDNTISIIEELKRSISTLRYVQNEPPNGFGYAVRRGLENFHGTAVAIMMADASDSPHDLVKFYEKLQEDNLDCVFGSRFINGGAVYHYPRKKLIINRIANNLVRLIFRIKYNDITNAFKLYRASTIQGLKPFLSPHFNLTLELPLKAIVRGYSYAILPNSWTNRKQGKSKLKIREMGSRYFFILLYCLIEKYFSANDFKKKWD